MLYKYIYHIATILWCDVFWMKMVWDEFGINWLNFYHNFTILQPNPSPEKFTTPVSELYIIKKKIKKKHEIGLKFQAT